MALPPPILLDQITLRLELSGELSDEECDHILARLDQGPAQRLIRTAAQQILDRYQIPAQVILAR